MEIAPVVQGEPKGHLELVLAVEGDYISLFQASGQIQVSRCRVATAQKSKVSDGYSTVGGAHEEGF